jgi:hypothetical protein
MTYLERLKVILSETPRGATDRTDRRDDFRNAPALGTDETEKFVNTRTTTEACRSVPYLEKTAGKHLRRSPTKPTYPLLFTLLSVLSVTCRGMFTGNLSCSRQVRTTVPCTLLKPLIC